MPHNVAVWMIPYSDGAMRNRAQGRRYRGQSRLKLPIYPWFLSLLEAANIAPASCLSRLTGSEFHERLDPTCKALVILNTEGCTYGHGPLTPGIPKISECYCLLYPRPIIELVLAGRWEHLLFLTRWHPRCKGRPLEWIESWPPANVPEVWTPGNSSLSTRPFFHQRCATPLRTRCGTGNTLYCVSTQSGAVSWKHV